MADFKKNAKNEATAFKKFISRGNVVDMAVGVIIGGAFGKIVTSLVNDIVLPLIGIALGGLDLKSLNLKIGESVVAYGKFLQSILDFFIIAVCIFAVVRVFEKFKKKTPPAAPKKTDESKLLEEIRDILKNQK